MLVLARKINQSIMIADNIELVIVDIQGDQVKVGIQAPKEIKIFRKEIYDEIQRENILAAGTSQQALDGLGGLFPAKSKEIMGKKDDKKR